MDSSESITEWAAKLPAGRTLQGSDKAVWRAERDEAFRHIYERFNRRVLGLVRRILSGDSCQRGDEEDVAQSAFKSFVRAQEEAATPLASREDLWRLLATIARRKTLNFRRYQRQQCRDVRREKAVPPQVGTESSQRDGPLASVAAPDSSADAEIVAGEVIEWLTATLGPAAGTTAVLRAEGHTVQEIASELHLSKRSVQLKLQIIRDELTKAMAQ